MGGYKIRQASCKFHHIMRLFFDNTLNFHLSQDNNCKNIWEACWRLYCEMGLKNHAFSRRKKQSHRQRGNLNSTLRISCQDVALLKGFGIKNKLKPRIRSVCYWLKYCIVGEKCKNNLSGRAKWLQKLNFTPAEGQVILKICWFTGPFSGLRFLLAVTSLYANHLLFASPMTTRNQVGSTSLYPLIILSNSFTSTFPHLLQR